MSKTDDLARRIGNLEDRVYLLRDDVGDLITDFYKLSEKIESDPEPDRVVSVMYVSSGFPYDYVDGIGDLKPGDVVVAPNIYSKRQQAVVISTTPVQRYAGELSTISHRIREVDC